MDTSMSSFDLFIISASRAFCSPIAIFIQIQGYLICLLLALGWALASYVRNREIRQQKDSMQGGNSFSFLSHNIADLEHSNQVHLPKVCVVLPLKGFGEHNLHNWRSQITSLYGGPLEFLFVVESTEDPAYRAINQLIADFEDEVDVKVIVAGLSTTCSQKVHNQLVGVERMHKETKYVLFLDDDVRFHPGSIGALTAEMEKNPDIFIQTGYPLDLPSGSLGSYCIYEYHMPCSMGFATGGRTFFLWGGCMMMHADDFRTDRHGIVSQLRDGGYSDDMTLAAISEHAGCVHHTLRDPAMREFYALGCPYICIRLSLYPLLQMHADDFRTDRHGIVSQLRDGGYSDDMTLAAISEANKRLITSPPVAVFPHPLSSDLSFSRYWNYLRKQTFVLESYTTKVNWIMNRALFTVHCYLSWGFVAPYVMALFHIAAVLRICSNGYSLEDASFTSRGLLLAGGLATCTLIELLSMWNLTRIEVQLCNLLSPEAPPLSLASYNWCLVFIAMVVDNFLYPISAFRSHFTQSVNWSGIRYHLKDGKISKIDRSRDKGPKFTDLGGKHLYGKKGAQPKASILGALSRSLTHWRQPKKFDV